MHPMTAKLAAILLPVVLAGAVVSTSVAAGTTHHAKKTTYDAYVSTKGTDAGNCSKASPCKTIDYAISQVPAGGSILVEPGTYHQTVSITKSVAIFGSGPGRTTMNGTGLDTTGPAYGVIYVGAAGGPVSVKDLSIVNPYPYSYTGGEPEAVALADPNSGDSIAITGDVIREGTADKSSGWDFPIGIDTFRNAAHTTISYDTIQGFFQGALLEDNGPSSLSHNLFQRLIANTYQGTRYPAEGIFFLSDLAGTMAGQNASHNSSLDYAGYGIAAAAGYGGGNCTSGCTGSLSGSILGNHFNLKGAEGAAAIALRSEYANDTLTMRVIGNKGTVTSPSGGLAVQSSNGGTISVSAYDNAIDVNSSSSKTGSASRSSGMSVPRHVKVFKL